MRIGAHLPEKLWPEITRAAVYLHNRTPNYANGWSTPYEIFFTYSAFRSGIVKTLRKPDLTHLKAYGCKAFAMTSDAHRGRKRLQRLDPRAWIGYLVGYSSSNIYRIWIPSLAKVISTRDVVFDEQTIFDGKIEDMTEDLMHATPEEIAMQIRIMEIPQPTIHPELQSFFEDDEVEDSTSQLDDLPVRQIDPDQKQHDEQAKEVMTSYPTPPPTPPPPVALLAQLMSGGNGTQSVTPLGSSKTVPWAAAFMAGIQAGNVGNFEGDVVDKAKAKRLLASGTQAANVGKFKGDATDKEKMKKLLASGEKIHRSQLPPPPTQSTKLEHHSMGDSFKEAERDHLASHHQMKSWVEVPHSPIKRMGSQILECMWVYTYKFDKHNNYVKCKARLVVRGDQQRHISSQDTYAATLANRSFRMLMAIAAKYNLELKQFDVTNAFVHASMDRDVYMRMPKGYQKRGTILKLQKALYGLRISPLLWQKEFTTTLKAIGFQVVPHEPCCLIKGGIIIFFYVDDIIVAYRRGNANEANQAIQLLKDKYTMTGGDDLQWFLGMEVIRDRQQGLLRLSQAAYVDKIHHLADKTNLRHDTPMAAIELKPSTILSTPSQINKYQRKIGSLLFAAVTTRPDIAFATSRLARFLTNPTQEHHDAADRVLLYLYDTRWLALQLGGGTRLQIASDASFADNTIDRKSSQGYAIKLFNGLIAWRASKQDTVTTSTTEAELLALSQVAKEAMFTVRLLGELKIRLPTNTIIIDCDNTQTIGLVTKEIAKLQTKLRHVDIHNHWLRQEVSSGKISVKYVESAEMIADGFTKVLPANRWSGFLQQVGLVEISEHKVEHDARLEEIQDHLEDITLQ
ncbi:uncharacterized protein CPUR_08864 [Claviceps purpurea 20.1]|uniref:Uncharacterized protein n=1 Tax=Claviceps purpurea (strain 20.1) TaxID=1111077 RepID=M1WDP2_CLAP2|nr:uncharacterized protein CPUR_08864 [Claviceps purpurea 20.1]